MSSRIAIDRLGFIVGHLLSVKQPCRVATTATITLSGTQTIDGVAVVDNDRVLVKDQADARDNGIWDVKAATWDRSSDCDQRDHVAQGTRILINEGTVNALTEWIVTTTGRPTPGSSEIEFEQYSAVASTFLQTGTGAVTRTWQDKAREILSGKDFGAVGDDLTDDSAEIAFARTAAGANRPIELIRGDYNASVTASLYPHSPQDALGNQWLLGTTATPATRHEPILWAEKVTASTRDAPSTSAFDQGAAYLSLEKRSGDAFGVAATAYALYSGGSGDLIAFHGRTRISAAGALSQRGYAGWFYTRVDAGVTPEAWHALELNGQNLGTDLGYLGNAQVVRIAMADGADVKASTAISIGLSGTTGDSGFYTGVSIEAESILSVGTTYTDGGEAIRVDGPALSADRIGGLRIAAGQYKYALRCDEGTYADTAPIIIAANDRVVWGVPATSTTWVRGGGAVDGLLTLRGGNGVVPSANDNTSFGTASLQWSDLFAVDAVLTGGMRVGFVGAPTADRIELGDANFCLDLNGLGDTTTSTLLFDSGDSLRYDRSGDTFAWRIGGSTKLTLTAALLNMVGGIQTDTLQIDATPAAVGTGTKTISNAADGTTNFGHYLTINMNGTPYFIPCSSVAPT